MLDFRPVKNQTLLYAVLGEPHVAAANGIAEINDPDEVLEAHGHLQVGVLRIVLPHLLGESSEEADVFFFAEEKDILGSIVAETRLEEALKADEGNFDASEVISDRRHIMPRAQLYLRFCYPSLQERPDVPTGIGLGGVKNTSLKH